VQRVPVRIALDAKELAQNPLRVGLSMEATVDVTDQSSKTLSDAPQAASSVQTQVFAAIDTQANAEVRKIIAANAPRMVR
jgi:membrane fusion protein (multidrug efflux system)